MPACHRRHLILAAAPLLLGAVTRPAHGRERFVAEAFRMRDEAVSRGDQSYGAVLVRAGEIVGHGPSRVVTDRNADAHAERVALWDAQRRLGSRSLGDTVMFSTSRPCAACERALAEAGVARMYVGRAATDAGVPRRDP
jgi:tRNA(Arg) A34 adenosine deaminase TadA